MILFMYCKFLNLKKNNSFNYDQFLCQFFSDDKTFLSNIFIILWLSKIRKVRVKDPRFA